MRIFVRDFIHTIVHFALSGIYLFLSFFINVYWTFAKFFKNIIVPFLIELGFDAKLFLFIALQGLYDLLSTLFLNLSKLFLSISKTYHNKSECIIRKYWEVF